MDIHYEPLQWHDSDPASSQDLSTGSVKGMSSGNR